MKGAAWSVSNTIFDIMANATKKITNTETHDWDINIEVRLLPPTGPPAPPNSIGMRMIYVAPGTFKMGSPIKEQEYLHQRYGANVADSVAENEKQREVMIAQPFYIGVYEVTQSEYELVMGRNPSWFAQRGGGEKRVVGLDTSQFPVEQVSWDDAVEFCRKLSQMEGKTYDLPTEEEWEYACRAGTAEPFYFGNSLSSRQANFYGDTEPYGDAKKSPALARTARVGSYQPNAFGLFDMHGNVWEWCKSSGAGTTRYMRGGAWNVDGKGCRAAYRNGDLPDRATNAGLVQIRVTTRFWIRLF